EHHRPTGPTCHPRPVNGYRVKTTEKRTLRILSGAGEDAALRERLLQGGDAAGCYLRAGQVQLAQVPQAFECLESIIGDLCAGDVQLLEVRQRRSETEIVDRAS